MRTNYIPWQHPSNSNNNHPTSNLFLIFPNQGNTYIYAPPSQNPQSNIRHKHSKSVFLSPQEPIYSQKSLQNMSQDIKLYKPVIQQRRSLPYAYYEQIPSERIKQLARSGQSSTGQSNPPRHIEPLLDPPPLPPNQCFVLSVQKQTGLENQRNHIYPDSSCDINQSKSREQFLQQSITNVKELIQSQKSLSTSIKQINSKQKSNSNNYYRFQRTQSHNSNTKILPQVIQQKQKQKDTTQDSLHQIDIEQLNSLSFKKAFHRTSLKTPEIPTFQYHLGL